MQIPLPSLSMLVRAFTVYRMKARTYKHATSTFGWCLGSLAMIRANAGVVLRVRQWQSCVTMAKLLTPSRWLSRCLKIERSQTQAMEAISPSMGWSRAMQSLWTITAAVVAWVPLPVSRAIRLLQPALTVFPEVKNPISLARQVLDLSTRELTLRRVPPNLLVGQGATDFAFDQGMAILPHDALVSPAARERWNRWKADLRSAERRAHKDVTATGPPRLPGPVAQLPPYEERPNSDRSSAPSKSVRNSVWNEGEPISPPGSAAGFRSSSGALNFGLLSKMARPL